jgi:outer membrane protein TolC
LLLIGLSIACLTGCAAFKGYRTESESRPLPDSLRTAKSPVDVSVALSAADRGNHDGFAGRRHVSLSEVVSVARERSNRVLEATARIDVASGRVQEAQGELLPGAGLDIGGSYIRGRDINNRGDVLDGLDYGRYEPSVSIFYRVNPGASAKRALRWKREADAAAYDASEARRTAALQAGVGYLDLVLAHASFQIAETLVTDAERFLNITHARRQAEIGSGADEARAEAEAARARQTALRARGRWEQASVRLAVLLRWNPGELLMPADRALRPLAIVDEARTQQLGVAAEEARPDLRAARARAEAASHLASSRRWDILGPELDAGLRERLMGRQIDDLDNTTLAHLFLGVSFDFGELGRLRAAEGQAHVAEIREQTRREQIQGEVTAAISNVRAAQQIIPEAQAGVEAAQRSYRIQIDRFQAGTGLGLEVIEAQNAQARARQELVEAIVRYSLAQVELAAAIGHLEPEILSTSSSARGEAAL